jgi:hypothetical protein
MDPTTIAILIGLGTLLIERTFKYLYKIKYSSCCGSVVVLKESTSENEID